MKTLQYIGCCYIIISSSTSSSKIAVSDKNTFPPIWETEKDESVLDNLVSFDLAYCTGLKVLLKVFQ